MSELCHNGAVRLMKLYHDDLSRMHEYQLKDLLKLKNNPKIIEETVDLCQMVSVPLDDKLDRNLFAKLNFQDGLSNSVASLPSEYAMFGQKEFSEPKVK